MRDRWILGCTATMVLWFVAACQTLESDLAIEIEPQEGLATRVTVRFRGDPSGQSVCSIAERWGGSSSEGEWFRGFEATSDSGEVALAVTSPTRVVLAHEPGAIVELTYRLVDLPGSFARIDDYRPIRSATSFMMVPSLGLFLPEHVGVAADGRPEVVDVEFEWEGVEDLGWRAFSSFGPDEGPHRAQLPKARLLETLLVAGSRDHAVLEDGRGQLGVVEIGANAAFTANQLASSLEVILRGVRKWFRAREDSWYLVGYAPAGEVVEGRVGLGGTALENSFVFFFDPSVDLRSDPDLFRSVAHVLCHEVIHRWNGGLFQIAEPDYEGQGSWFTEGFTEWIARWVLVAMEVYGVDGYREALNERIYQYESNPDRDRPFREVIEQAGDGSSANALAYQRGELVAFWVDDQVRRQTDGSESLRDLFGELSRLGRRGDRVVPEEFIWDWVAQRCGVEFVDEVRRVIAEGGRVPLPKKLFERPFVLVDGPQGFPIYRLGDR
ncbi:MAG: hypothetical protein AAF196_02730 [Planctomycetota bacterium]